jgi:hypothetical protein
MVDNMGRQQDINPVSDYQIRHRKIYPFLMIWFILSFHLLELSIKNTKDMIFIRP